MLRAWLCGAMMVLALGGGCSRGARELAEGAVVVAFGDSLTEGYGADVSESYPEVLEKLVGRKVVNAGVSGERSDGGVARLPQVLSRERPTWVVLCHGGNDMLWKQPDDMTARNLREMVRLAQDSGARVVLLGVPRPGVVLRTADFYADVARETGVVYDGKRLTSLLAKPSLKSDPIHLNADGYRKLAERVAELLRKHDR